MENIALSYGESWNRPFVSELEMMLFLKGFEKNYVDEKKLKKYIQNYIRYISPMMERRILTYDAGYHLRQESLLKELFPDTKITACVTHASSSIAMRRGIKGSIDVRTFYPAEPWVSGIPREALISENAPSCTGYDEDGRPLFEEGFVKNKEIEELQKHAGEFIEKFASVFQGDLFRITVGFTDACHPFESFLHSPGRQNKKWAKGLFPDSDDFSLRQLQRGSFQSWEKARLSYKMSALRFGKLRKRAAIALYLAINDWPEFKCRLKKHIPFRISIRTGGGRK